MATPLSGHHVAVWSAFIYVVANSDVDFRPKP